MKKYKLFSDHSTNTWYFLVNLFFIYINCIPGESFSQNIGIGTITPKARLHIVDSSVLFSAIGDIPVTFGNPPIQGTGRRMMWYPDKAAFRVGFVLNNNWDVANIGNYSFACGNNTKAPAYGSFSTGLNTIASGQMSVAFGENSLASGQYALATGYSTTASEQHSTAIGSNTHATGQRSIASGFLSTASGAGSIASGELTSASGYLSVAMGSGTISPSYLCVSLGQYNYSTPTSGISWVSTDPIIIVGNGSSSFSRSNILEYYKNGNLGIAGTYYQYSDERLKKDIKPLNNSLVKITQLNGYNYYWKDSGSDQTKQTGMLAQEIQSVFPELIHNSLKGDLMINYNGLIPYLIESVKELKKIVEQDNSVIAEIAGLKNRVEMAEQQNKDLLKRLELLETR